MTLREFMDKKKYSCRSLGAALGIQPAQLSRYVTGKHLPSLKTAYVIYKFSKKKIKLEDWFNENKN